MHGYDLIRLKAEAQVAMNCLAKAIEKAQDDPTRAFAAIEDARKHLQQMYCALYPEHLRTIKRTP